MSSTIRNVEGKGEPIKICLPYMSTYRDTVSGRFYRQEQSPKGSSWKVIKSFKSYLALASQTGTDDPIVNVIHSDFDGDIVWTYAGFPGYFYGTLPGAFISDKVIGKTSLGQKLGAGGMCLAETFKATDDSVFLITSELLTVGNSVAPTAGNGIIVNQLIEIMIPI